MTRYVDYIDYGDLRVYHVASRRGHGWQWCFVVRTLSQMGA